MPFILSMKAAHEAKGLTPYKVWKETGVVINTVLRYTAEEEVELQYVAASVAILSKFYGYEWHELTRWVEEIETPAEDEDIEETKTLLATA